MANNPIPGDQSRWGRFDALQDRNREILHKMLEDASAPKPGRGAIEQKMGDYYAACMNEAAIDAKGAAPLKPDLDRIAAIQNKAGIAEVVAYLFRTGSAPFFRFGSGPDAKNSSQVIADLDQGGLGLPDRDYYSRPTKNRWKFASSTWRTFRKCWSWPASSPERRLHRRKPS